MSEGMQSKKVTNVAIYVTIIDDDVLVGSCFAERCEDDHHEMHSIFQHSYVDTPRIRIRTRFRSH